MGIRMLVATIIAQTSKQYESSLLMEENESKIISPSTCTLQIRLAANDD